MRKYVTMGRRMSPFKNATCCSRIWIPSNRWFIGPTWVSPTKRHLDPSLHSSPACQTHRHVDDATCDICSNRPHQHTACGRCGLTQQLTLTVWRFITAVRTLCSAIAVDTASKAQTHTTSELVVRRTISCTNTIKYQCCCFVAFVTFSHNNFVTIFTIIQLQWLMLFKWIKLQNSNGSNKTYNI